MMIGTASRLCHIESRKFTYKELKNQDGLMNFLDDRWTRKERLLSKFVHTQSFCTTECGEPVRIPINGSIWRSLMPFAFYVTMWVGLAFSYAKYSTDAESFFNSIDAPFFT